MQKHPIYFRTDQSGELQNGICFSKADQKIRGIVEMKRMIVMSVLAEKIRSEVATATEDIAIETKEDDPEFDAGASLKHQSIRFAGQTRRIRLAHRGTRVVEVDTEYEIPPSKVEANVQQPGAAFSSTVKQLQPRLAVEDEVARERLLGDSRTFIDNF